MSETQVARDQLRAFVERIEKLEEDRATTGSDISYVYSEAKSNGFNTKVLRDVIKRRKQDQNELLEHEAVLELYMDGLKGAGA